MGEVKLIDPRAAWLTEPDKSAWTDPATGYACLILRQPHGALCGYVALPAGHPAHGLNGFTSSYELDEVISGEAARKAPIQAQLNELCVHGGVTYARHRSPLAGETEGRWWLGFDCAHAGDFSPRTGEIDHPVLGLGRPTGWGSVITYRNLPYVEAECASLARQLAEIAGA